VWVEGDHTFTSIHSYNELYVQVFDDFFFEENLIRFASTINDEEMVHALKGLLVAFKTLDESVEATPAFANPATLLASSMWQQFKESVRLVVSLPYSEPFLR
jgi:hypothetical protein